MTKPERKRVKWEPPALMIAVLIFGLWLVMAVRTPGGIADLRDGAAIARLTIGPVKGVLEMARDDQGLATYRVLRRDGTASPLLTRAQLETVIGAEDMERLHRFGFDQPPLTRAAFRAFNITGWASLAWVAVGLAGQLAFFGRMAIQWILSERRRESVVPEIFWWLSLGGGLGLFVYFVWRQDIVGVLGQSTGVVIYARNLRLIHKRRRREARDALLGETTVPTAGDDAASP